MTALDLVQQALENVARVVDTHGDLDNKPDSETQFYSLEIAIESLQEAEAILERS